MEGEEFLNKRPVSVWLNADGNDRNVVESGRCEEVHISDINVVAYEKD